MGAQFISAGVEHALVQRGIEHGINWVATDGRKRLVEQTKRRDTRVHPALHDLLPFLARKVLKVGKMARQSKHTGAGRKHSKDQIKFLALFWSNRSVQKGLDYLPSLKTRRSQVSERFHLFGRVSAIRSAKTFLENSLLLVIQLGNKRVHDRIQQLDLLFIQIKGWSNEAPVGIERHRGLGQKKSTRQ